MKTTTIKGFITLHHFMSGLECLIRPHEIVLMVRNSATERTPEHTHVSHKPEVDRGAYSSWDRYSAIPVRETPAEIADLIRDMPR